MLIYLSLIILAIIPVVLFAVNYRNSLETVETPYGVVVFKRKNARQYWHSEIEAAKRALNLCAMNDAENIETHVKQINFCSKKYRECIPWEGTK